MTPPTLLLAQAPTVQTSMFGLDSLFFLSLLFIFATAIVTALVTKWSRDKCLKFFAGDHVTLERDDGRCVWGELEVYSQGVEVTFASPGTDRIGRRRSSVMVYPAELDAATLAILRYDDALSPKDREQRRKQVKKTFNPGFWRRWTRKVRNLVNTLRDAFSKALGAFVGQVAKANPGSTVLSSQQSGVTQIGDTLLSKAANAYEPMLEAHVGRPVILDVNRPKSAGGGTVSYPGFLADYTAKFVAIFNVEHPAPGGSFTLTVPAEGEAEPACVKSGDAAEGAGCAVELSAKHEAGRLIVGNGGFDPCVVDTLERDGFEPIRLGATVAPGASLSLPSRDAAGAVLTCRRVRTLDVVAPRSQAVVRHAGELLERRSLLDDLGLDELPLVPRRTTNKSA